MNKRVLLLRLSLTHDSCQRSVAALWLFGLGLSKTSPTNLASEELLKTLDDEFLLVLVRHEHVSWV